MWDTAHGRTADRLEVSWELASKLIERELVAETSTRAKHMVWGSALRGWRAMIVDEEVFVPFE